jgi:AbiV family abortive infection protein
MEEISKALMCSYGSIGIYSVKRSNLTSHVIKQKFLSISLMTMTLLKWDKLASEIVKRFKDPKSKPISDDELPNSVKKEMDEVMEFMMDANRMKETGFYVDIDEEGEPVAPDEVITKDNFPSFYFDTIGPIEINKGVISNIDELSDYYNLIMRPDVFSKLFPKTINQQLSESIKTTVVTIKEEE